MELEPEQLELLELIKKIWRTDPSLRFLQLIGNCLGPVSTGDIYFIDDNTLSKGLRCQYGRGRKEKL